MSHAKERCQHQMETRTSKREPRIAPFNAYRKLCFIVEYNADRIHVDIVRSKLNLPFVMTLYPKRSKYRKDKGRKDHSQSSSICHTSATTAIMSPFLTDTVIISRCISVGSCTFNRYFELDGVMCMGGVREGEGARLARAVGDGSD